MRPYWKLKFEVRIEKLAEGWKENTNMTKKHGKGKLYKQN